MFKQKIRAFLLAFLSFGMSVSFIRHFGTAELWEKAVLAVEIVLLSAAACSVKARKDVLETAVKLQPLAAVVFTASFILSFLTSSTTGAQLFAVLALNAVCLCMAFENLKTLSRRSFAGLFCMGAAAGTGVAFSAHVGLVYTGFVLFSLLCRPKTQERTVQDVWKDIAFPLFVLLGAFILFIAANHNGSFPSVIAESIVMLMVGGLLMTPCSSLRLTLMTIVLMLFGSYVFSAQNAQSVFNRKPLVQIERSL
ncbi:MAG: hypothetical protein IKR09_04050 [Alphaproteobacteria bacterium]|nr:hypothetical protein [Alphaproteobacteria bacterium]